MVGLKKRALKRRLVGLTSDHDKSRRAMVSNRTVALTNSFVSLGGTDKRQLVTGVERDGVLDH